MILHKIYNEIERIQECWYDSSMFRYTKMVEDKENNYGDLYVMFKNGTTYMYKDVLFEDYVLLINGGTDDSNGKTLNKLIKPKYQCSKMDDFITINEVNEKLERLLTEEKNIKTLEDTNTQNAIDLSMVDVN